MEAGERRLTLSSTSSKSRKLTVHVNRQCRLCGARCHLSKGEVNQECLLSPRGSRCSRSMMATLSPSSSAVCRSQVSMPLPFRTCSMRWPSFLRLAIVSHAEILAGLKQPPVGGCYRGCLHRTSMHENQRISLRKTTKRSEDTLRRFL